MPNIPLQHPQESIIQWSHHVHIPKKYDVKRLMTIIEHEAMEQLEPGQNLGVFPFQYHLPTNTLK